MDIKEIEEQINEVRQAITLATVQLDRIERNTKQIASANKDIKWTPETNHKYWYVDSRGIVEWEYWQSKDSDIYRYSVGNCFKYQCEASEYKELLQTKQALRDLALELNDGVGIDWDNIDQIKYVVYFDSSKNIMNMCEVHWTVDTGGQICCLNENFLSLARERIGEEKLIKLIKSGV